MKTKARFLSISAMFLALLVLAGSVTIRAEDSVTLTVVDNYLVLSNYWTHVDRATVFSPGDGVQGILQMSGTCNVIYPKVDVLFKIDEYGLSFTNYNDSIDCDPSWVWEYKHAWGIPDDISNHGDVVPFDFEAKSSNYPSNTIKQTINFTVSMPTVLEVPAAYEPALQPPEPTGIKDYLKNYILNGRKAVKNTINQSPKLAGGVAGELKPNMPAVFLSYLKTKRPYVVLLHARGSTGRIYFPDGDYLDSQKIRDAQLPSPPGLFFAASSYSAWGGLDAALCNSGWNGTYKAFIGFECTLYATRAVDFYKYFFAQARQTGVTVATALQTTKAWALQKGWTDVGYLSKLYGSGDSLYLGGKGTGVPVEAAQQADTPPPFIRWRNINTYRLTPEEEQAVALANRSSMVKQLRARYGSRLATGIETFAMTHRVAYRLKKNGFLYGVDVDRTTGRVEFEGQLN